KSVTISGTVYEDKDASGSLTAGDVPIAGTTVTLSNGSGTTFGTTTTAADGTYSFTTSNGQPLAPGTYKITEAQPSGYLQGTNTVGTVNGTAVGTLVRVYMIGSIVLASGQSSAGTNFGEIKGVTISGNVYEDKDRSGSLTASDLPISGVTLTLVDGNGT